MSSGCGCKEVHVYRFPHITYIITTPLVSALFLQSRYKRSSDNISCSFF